MKSTLFTIMICILSVPLWSAPAIDKDWAPPAPEYCRIYVKEKDASLRFFFPGRMDLLGASANILKVNNQELVLTKPTLDINDSTKDKSDK